MNVRLQEIKNQMEKLKEEYDQIAHSAYFDELKKLFAEYPKLNSFSISVNNHEFNDGDATHFSVYAENPELNECSNYNLRTGTEENALERTGLTLSEVEEIGERIKAIFDTFDDILEDLYEDAYESITFTREEHEEESESNGEQGDE